MHCRSRRPRFWLILAITAMLWTQVVSAMHGACAMPPMPAPADVAPEGHGMHDAGAHAAPAMAEGHHCEAKVRRAGSATCDAHCDQKTGSAEVARVPPVPALLPAPFAFAVGAVLLPAAQCIAGTYSPPDRPPRGPTRHPAPLLLI
ncbi:MAG: hypothetical protein EPO46_08710 [Lysobacter sp.]|nr:MAG: hypothetical protein EPO46_08710 [Lysobacter sp.]